MLANGIFYIHKVKLFPVGSRQKSAHLCDFQESSLKENKSYQVDFKSWPIFHPSHTPIIP